MSKYPFLLIVLGTLAGLVLGFVLVNVKGAAPAPRASEGPNISQSRASMNSGR